MKRLIRFLLLALCAALWVGFTGQLMLLLNQPAQSVERSSLSTPVSPHLPVLAPLHARIPASDARFATFLEADRLYRQGDVTNAEQLYRQVKPEFDQPAVSQIPEPIYEAEALDPVDLERWKRAEAAIAADQEEVAIENLQPLIEHQPAFIPGILQLAKLLQEEDQEDEAIAVLEQAATLYPYSAEIVMAQVLALEEDGKHLEASIAAREFALLNLDHPQAPEFKQIADEELSKFSRSRRRESIWGGLGNIAAQILTGNAPWESVESAVKTAEIVQMMLASESDFGNSIAGQYRKRLSIVEDQEVNDYVTQLGLEVAKLMGRNFDYEFYVVQDGEMNAFALPGGKIFVNTGAILAANSQAELAGVLAHEVAHSVLSHGVQSMFRDNMLAQFAEEVPLGNFVAGLVSLHYSREQERKADILGNRVLATAGYAADGLRNFMATLNQASQATPLEYLSSHPAPTSRIEYLEELIQRNGYNRYALEGVDQHSAIQAKLSA